MLKGENKYVPKNTLKNSKRALAGWVSGLECCPEWPHQRLRVWYPCRAHTRAAGSVLSRGANVSQLSKVPPSQPCLSLFLFLLSSLSLKSMNISSGENFAKLKKLVGENISMLSICCQVPLKSEVVVSPFSNLKISVYNNGFLYVEKIPGMCLAVTQFTLSLFLRKKRASDHDK